MTDKELIALSASHFEFLAKMLRGARSVSQIKDGKKLKAVPSWKVAAQEAEIAAKKLRDHLSA